MLTKQHVAVRLYSRSHQTAIYHPRCMPDNEICSGRAVALVVLWIISAAWEVCCQAGC